MRRRATLADVAAAAGVSRTAASFVLNDAPGARISEDARQRVLRAAHELDYRPNLMARALRTRETRTIALVSDTIATEPYAGRLAHGALVTAAAHGRLLLVAETEGDPELEARLVAECVDRQVDGFVYAAMHTRVATVPPALAGRPLVLLNCVADTDAGGAGGTVGGNGADGTDGTDGTDGAVDAPPAVVPDERAAGAAAVRLLLDAGHTTGVCLVGEPALDLVAGRERVTAIVDTLAAAGHALAARVDCRWWPEPAYEAVTAFLRAGGAAVATALVCLNDRVALGACQALRDAGLTVPRDVSVVSFDDSELASWLRPQLTSIALPHREMGRVAVEALLARRRDGAVVRVPMPVRRRASVAAPAR